MKLFTSKFRETTTLPGVWKAISVPIAVHVVIAFLLTGLAVEIRDTNLQIKKNRQVSK